MAQWSRTRNDGAGRLAAEEAEFVTNLTSDLTGKSNRSTKSTVLNSTSALKSERLR